MKISIIIPVYNVEKYLRDCLESVIKQIVDDTELVIVDDGSTDNSGIICDEYSKKYNFIKLIHKQNEGVSVARNIGIKEATGKYIMFLDSDDLLADGILSTIFDEIENESDMYTFSFEKIDQNGLEINSKNKKLISKNYEKKCFLKNYYKKYKSFPWSVWQSVFKKEIIDKNNITFPVGIKVAEDTIFYMTYIEKIEKINYIDEHIIKYRVNRDGSAMKTMKASTIENVLSIYSDYYYGNDEFLSKYFSNFYVSALMYILKVPEGKERKKIIDSIDSEIVKKATGIKYSVFKIFYFIIGKERTIKILSILSK